MSAVRLGDHAKLIRGITFKPVDKCDPHDERTVVCMRTKNVQATLDASDLIAVPRNLVKNSEKMLSTGDILVSSANSWNLVGKCCQVPTLQYPSTAGAFISILRPKTEQLESSYLYRWFSSVEIQRRLRSFANQTTNISNLNHKKTLELQIPLPPLPEQKRIAGILDAADALRAKRREALAQLDTLLQSTFLDMFGDPVTNPKGLDVELLGELIAMGPQNGLYKPERNYGSGVRILRIDGFYGGVVNDPSTLKRVNVSEQDIEKYGLSESDIVINRVNSRSHLGKSALIPDLGGEPILFESNMMRLAVDSTRVSPLFMIHFLQTSFIRNQILRSAKDSINQASINQGDVKGLRILVPSVDSQQHFVSIAESIGHQKSRCCAHLDELDTLFASLQSRAFRGDL